MPRLAHRPCSSQGCSEYAVPGEAYCAKHLEAERDRRSKTRRGDDQESIKLYRSPIWKRMRTTQLMNEPLCAECFKRGIIKPATDCDHIVPHKGDLRLFFDRKNLQSLCHSCHSQKTASEDGGFGHKTRASSPHGTDGQPLH